MKKIKDFKREVACGDWVSNKDWDDPDMQVQVVAIGNDRFLYTSMDGMEMDGDFHVTWYLKTDDDGKEIEKIKVNSTDIQKCRAVNELIDAVNRLEGK